MKHDCGRYFSRAWRLVLAGLQDDEDAWNFVRDEIGDCTACWNSVARQLTSMFVGHFALRAGSLEKATDVAAMSIAEEVLPR